MTEDVKDQQPSELDSLKARAKQLGINHHWNIGVDKLRELVNETISPTPMKEAVEEKEEPTAPIQQERSDPRFATAVTRPVRQAGAPSKKTRAEHRKDASKLVRVRVNCMNPDKTEWEGEIFTISNSVVGTFKKYVPFNNEEGWHIPNIIYQHLKERQCQVFANKKNRMGETVREGKLIREFAIEVLDPLTKAELKSLAQRQAMADGTSE